MHSHYSVLPISGLVNVRYSLNDFQIICSASSLFHTNRHLSIETRYFAHAVNSLSTLHQRVQKKKWKNEINRENGV